ncbi:FtsX-like permease family protein [uncultured Tenacibaculum sp.]|uniref:ABC transporter permease n=1 Tax=uncultured Tenacibaculum sp. TaxID=174713 RepID=UPI002602120E|nr:FtsX-like permease family protein [uncultured Tenacibaculum sp.]
MKFSLYIAKRYLFSKSGTNAINIITFIATFSVVVGTIALFVVLSGFSGLRTFSDSLLEASDPAIKIIPAKGKTFVYTEKLDEVLRSNKAIQVSSKVIEERVSLKYKNKNHIAYIKGVDELYNQIVTIDSSLTVGRWLDKEYRNTAVVGYGIFYKLSLGVLDFGEPLQIFVPKPGKGFINPNNAFNSVSTQVIGVYSGSEEFQNKYVYTNIDLARVLLNYSENTVTGLELKLKDSFNNADVRDELQNALGSNYVVKTKKQLNALYYKVVNTENFISYLIFTLIIIIALFNVIGSIIMMIIDKRKNLKTLLSLGASIKEVKNIFVYQGFLLVLVGMIVGLVLGISLVLIQLHYGVFMIAYNLPYPVEFRWTNLLVVATTITILGYVAAKIASSRISVKFIEK